jgi:hypothetical protein
MVIKLAQYARIQLKEIIFNRSFSKRSLVRQSSTILSPHRNASIFDGLDTFDRRHLGPNDAQVKDMCRVVGVDGLEDLVNKTIPATIHSKKSTRLGKALTESETLARIKEIASKNKVFKSYLGMGYYSAITPPVILRNVMENPGWYTQVRLFWALVIPSSEPFLFVVHSVSARNCTGPFRITSELSNYGCRHDWS